MSSASMIVLCASALFAKTIYGQCLLPSTPYFGAPVAAPISWGPGCGSNVAAASGGGFGVVSSSLYAPTGLSVRSENEISGILDASGNLPVLATVALESSLPTSGSVGTTYSCGSGHVGINSDSLAAAGIDAAGYGANAAGAFSPGAISPLAYSSPTFNAAPCGHY